MAQAAALAGARARLQAGDAAGAADALAAFLRDRADDGEAWFLLGAARHRLHDAAAARDAFQRAAEVDRHHLECRYALAALSLELGDPERALAACREAVQLAPAAPKAWFSLAVAEEAGGLADDALASYGRVLALQPEHSEALTNRAALLLAQGRIDDAIADNRRLAGLRPYAFAAQFNLGDALLRGGCHAEAAAAFGRAVRLAPGNAKALLHAGFALAQCERFADAQRLLDQARTIDPEAIRAYRRGIFGDAAGDALDARVLFLLRHYDAIERCDWRERTHFIDRFTALIRDETAPPLAEKALGFRAMAMGLGAADQLRLARNIAAAASAGVATPAAAPRRPAATAGGTRRIRLAYLSQDFRVHPTGLLTADLYGGHDRSRFEVFGYALGGDDGSEVRQRIAVGCDRFVDLGELDDAAAAARIAADAPDIAIDLCGYADRSRPGVLAHCPAPLQLALLAYMATMGAPWIDYFVGDRCSLPPGSDAGFSEALLRLPGAPYPCGYAAQPLPAPPARGELGLPADGLVLAALHNPYKIDPAVFAVWMRLLQQIPAAVLWLADAGAGATANLRGTATAHGIDPGRLRFAPRLPLAEHLCRLQQADLFLDTPQYNGGTTTADVLTAGVPVLSCAGGLLAQRMAASLLRAAGQAALVTDDLAAYEARALSLLQVPARLGEARRALAAARASAPFFRPQRWLRDFERGLEQVWRRHGDGLPPAAIDVGA
ncbi:MAG: tetratricopeptide repeat protein [Rhodocyclales bacterium]|nr:tetratricopeptide repeat protein [Rhodocyclales bacterium]